MDSFRSAAIGGPVSHDGRQRSRPVASLCGMLLAGSCALGSAGCLGPAEPAPSTAPGAGFEPSSGAATAAGPGSPEAPAERPAALEPRAGATLEGHLEPGETVRHPIHLEEGQYIEAHLDRGRYEADLHLVPPETADERDPIGSGEHSADPPGQALWGLVEQTGTHDLVVRHETDVDSARYRITVLVLRPAGRAERARQAGQEAWERAMAALGRGHHGDALDHLRPALEHWKRAGYVRGAAAVHSRLGQSLGALQQTAEAVEHIERAIELWDRAGDSGAVALNLMDLARAEAERHRWEAATEASDRALELTGDGAMPELFGHALATRCTVHRKRGEIQRALAMCQRAVARWEERDELAEAAVALNDIGLMHRRMGHLDRAREYYDRVLEILEDHPNRLLEATLYHNLGTLFDSNGEFQKALVQYQKALAMAQDQGNRSKVASQYYNIGTVHERMGELDTTLAYYRRARAIQEELGGAGEDLILTLLGIGRVHVLQARPDLAREPMERGLAMSRATGAKFLIALGLRRMAHLEIEAGRPDDAIERIAEALVLARDMNNRWEESILLSHFATAQLEGGRTDEALAALREAAEVNEEIGFRRELARNYFEMARIHRARGELVTASRRIDETLAIAARVRRQVSGRQLRALVGATHQEYHDFSIDLLMERHSRDPEGGHAAQALRTAERARAQSLLEVLGRADLGLRRRIPPELVARREELRRRLATAETRRARLLEADAAADPVERFRVTRDLDSLLTGLAEVEREIRRANPSYAALTRSEPLTLGEIQDRVLDQETTLLEFRLGQDRSFLFVVSPDRFETFELPGRNTLEESARCLHWLITAFADPDGAAADAPRLCLGRRAERFERPPGGTPFEIRAWRRRQIEEVFAERAADLSEALLGAAFRSGLLAAPRLAVVADGALEYVPLAALPGPGTGKRLLHDHEIVHLPSASVLAHQRRRPDRDPELRGTLAILADPAYALNDERAAPADGTPTDPRTESGTRSYARLGFASQEARAIAALAPPEETRIWIGPAVTRKAATGAVLSGFRYVHFATHGVIDARYPALSGLVLSQVDGAGRRVADGFLRLHDIYDMRLDAELVVLSACETALGREIRGEGLVGLARGFMYAGADRVVASLWRVQDAATSSLMEDFYAGLLVEGRSPADALRRAQLTMLSESGGRLSFPYYWAGFELQGEWR